MIFRVEGMSLYDTDLLTSVKHVLASEWNLPLSEIPDDAALNRHPSWDSLGHIRVMLALQSELGVNLNEETIQSLSSIPRIVEHLKVNTSAEIPAS